MIPIRDLVNFGVWFAGFFSNTIHWRGLVFRVKQGMLIPLSNLPLHNGPLPDGPLQNVSLRNMPLPKMNDPRAESLVPSTSLFRR
jgi:hypothetical protein